MLPMFQKTVIAGAVLAATSSLALANGGGFAPPPAPCCHISNAYVGIAVSRDRGNLAFEANTEFTARTNKTDTSMEGVDGQLFAGYGWLFRDHYYLAVEGFGTLTNNKGYINGPVNVEQDWDAGVSSIPGIKVTDSTLLYARVGWAITRFELKNGTGGARFNENTRNAIQAGLGLATMLTNNLGIRGEWVWSRYQSLTVDHPGGAGEDPNVVVHDRVRPLTDQFKFGVLYNFNMA